MKKKVLFILGLTMSLMINGLASASTSVHTGGINVIEGVDRVETVLESTASPSIEYVEGLNDNQTVSSAFAYAADWFGITYTPTVSYDLKKVELMAGGGMLHAGVFIVQLRLDSAGWPSNIVQREANFTMVNTVSWQGAEFATSYLLTADTAYWIVFKPVRGSRLSMAISGDPITHVWDYGGDGWDGKITIYPWMARFYKESAEFQYHVRIRPFDDVLSLNASGSMIFGVDDTASYSNQPVLGTFSGDNFYICIDFTKDNAGDPIYYEMALIVGHVSTRSGNMYQTADGKSWVGPTSVTLVSVTSPEASTTRPSLGSAPTVEPEPKGWPPTYHVNVSPFVDVLHMHVEG